MIKINTAQIGPEGLHIDGEEDSAILELESIHGIPVFRCSPIHYDLNATMVGQDLLVTGSAFVELETECVTCLDRIKVKVGDPKICVHIEKVPEEEVDMTPRGYSACHAFPVQMFGKLQRALLRMRRQSEYGKMPLLREKEKTETAAPQ